VKKIVNFLNLRAFLSLKAAGFLLWVCFGLAWPTPAFSSPGDGAMLDLVFVIDNSGSMRKNDPNFITPQVVQAFVRQLPGLTQVGMVLFDQNARLLSPMTRISDEKADQEIIASLKKIDYRGQRTNTPVGIERAIYELKTNGRPLAQKGIVLITDGIVDTGDPRKDEELSQWLKEDLTAQCKQLGIRIFGIALTEAADFSLIQTLAMRTDGEYFRTYQASEVSAVLEQIQTHLTPAPKPALAPLPLLPEPSEPPTAEPTQTVQEAGPAPQNPLAEKAVVVTEKSAWMISMTLVLVIVALIGALVFFFIQNTKRKGAAAETAEKKTNIPEAHLEDLDNICGQDNTAKKLDKAQINIGRSQRNDIVIQQSAISGFHATIEFRNRAFYLEDQRSTNGTQLNGSRLAPNEPVRLKSGDRITFAKYDFKFIMVGQVPFGDTVMISMTAMADPEAEATIMLDLDGADRKMD